MRFVLFYGGPKCIDDVVGMIDVYNWRLKKALSAFDTPHQFIGSWVYRLPFGKGRMVGSSWNSIGNAVLGGWGLDGIVRVQSGQSVAIRGHKLGPSPRID